MNVFIVAVCVNLITLLSAAHDINFDTILKILKQKPRKSGYSNTNESIEAIPIIPGFYLQKPTSLSKSLFENPKAGPADLFRNLSSEDTKTRHNKTRISAKSVNKRPTDVYLKGRILKAFNKYIDIQKNNNDNIIKIEPYQECDNNLICKKYKLSKSKEYVAQKEPVKKLLGRIFQGIKGGIDYRGKGKYKKPRKQETSSKNEKKIGKLLKKLLYGNINNKKYRGHEKYKYFETEEQSKKKGDLLGSIVNAIQNSKQGRGSEISTALLNDNEYELENNAKESMEVSDEGYDGSNPLNLYHTRRNDKPDIGSRSHSDTSASSASSDYEKNPGNPFTIHKNKYKQNWPYNHVMDGDHMNINPFGPQFANLAPSGPELFFGRKWWYFNQDDYKPLR